MKKALPWILLTTLFLAIIGGALFIAVGNGSGLFGTSFRAIVISVDPEHDIYVIEGLSSNSQNHRGLYAFKLTKDIKITWNTTVSEEKEFRIGDVIAISYSGSLKEESPAHLPNVKRITLVERTE